MGNEFLDAALEYCNMGFSVIPIVSGKKMPSCIDEWGPYQKEKASTEQIERWWKMWPNANVGIVTGKLSNLCVIDLDEYKPDFDMEEALKYIPENIITPTVKTPRSGTHLYFRLPESQLEIRGDAGTVPAIDFRANGNYIVAPPSKIGKKKYQWLDGLALTDIPFEFLPSLYSNVLNTKTLLVDTTLCSNQKSVVNGVVSREILQKGTRDNDLFKIGMAMADGHAPAWMIEQTLQRLALAATPPFSLAEIPKKLKSIIARLERKERNLLEEVREWILLQKGYFFTTDVLQTLQITTKEEKKYLTVILVRLQHAGTIEKHGDRRGCYRLIDKTENEMKFIEEDIYEYDVKLPFGLNDMCKLYPKNIIVVAGSKGAGKTALLLNIAKMNQDTNEILYINSEMGNEEWTDRMKALGYAKTSDIKYRTIEHHSSFHDVINGDKKIYILDYLEIHDNFYEIAKPIRHIHEKLNDGICIIGIQKKTTERLARGAEFSMEKSRLYLTLDYLDDEFCSKLTIVDAKTPKIPGGVRGLYKRIKILNGANMQSMDATWRR